VVQRCCWRQPGADLWIEPRVRDGPWAFRGDSPFVIEVGDFHRRAAPARLEVFKHLAGENILPPATSIRFPAFELSPAQSGFRCSARALAPGGAFDRTMLGNHP